MSLRRASLPLLSLVLLLCCVVALRGQAYTTIVVFGDSLSDTGNFARLSSNAYGGGLRIPGPVGGYTDGRFTDGTDTAPPAQMYAGVWVEQMAATLAAKPAVKASLDGGTNYSYGSATNAGGTQVVMYGPSNLFTVTVQNVGAQIAAYLATKPVITNKTLFVVWCGANDLLQATSGTQIAAAATQDVANVQALITAGGTDFLIPNLPPLGAIPRLNGNVAGSVQATAGASAYNAALLTGLGTLAAANMGKALHISQMDIFSLFNSILASPSLFGIANDTQVSQLKAVNPDTYLFWDDLHPTTYGHYLISRLAGNVLTETKTSMATLTVGATTAVPGQTVSLKAVVVAAGGGTLTPTGVVTFYNGTTPLVAAMLDASGMATSSFPAGPVSSNATSLTASYSGDGVYFPNTSAPQAFTVTAGPVATTTTLSSSGANLNLGAQATFTATVSSMVGTPTGSVTFLDGTATLGTATLAAGSTSSTATYTTSALGVGAHSITAVFGAGGAFLGSTSAALSEVVTAPSYTFTASPTTVTVASGSSGTTTLTVTPVGGLTGTYALACGTLPAHFSCSFSTTSVVLAGAAVSSTLTIGTSAATASLRIPARSGWVPGVPVYAGLVILPGLALLGRRRRRLGSLGLTAALLVLSAAGALGVSGCAKSSNNAASGTYQVPVTATPSGGGSATSLTVTVVVQ